MTMRDWGELWLNEGFATYFENVGASLARPNFAYFDTFYADYATSAMETDAYPKSTHPLATLTGLSSFLSHTPPLPPYRYTHKPGHNISRVHPRRHESSPPPPPPPLSPPLPLPHQPVFQRSHDFNIAIVPSPPLSLPKFTVI